MKDNLTDNALTPADLDQLGQAVLTLTQELWVMKDRQRVLEALLEAAGVLMPGAIDQHEPDATLTAQLSTERRRLIDQVIGTLHPSDDTSAAS